MLMRETAKIAHANSESTFAILNKVCTANYLEDLWEASRFRLFRATIDKRETRRVHNHYQRKMSVLHTHTECHTLSFDIGKHKFHRRTSGNCWCKSKVKRSENRTPVAGVVIESIYAELN